MDENEFCDWSKLDAHVVRVAKTFNFTPSMFGTFDFDYVANASQAVQKERKARRKADPGVEKRPISVTQSETAKEKTTKVDQVLIRINEVSLEIIFREWICNKK